MLIKFEVENYAGFKERFSFDLTSAKRYNYNQYMVNKKTIMKSLVYGPNASGKTSLCMALLDITYHVVDKEKFFISNDLYLNVGNNANKATFIYTFKFGNDVVKYEYAKSTQTTLIYERLFLNGDLILEYNFYDYAHNINKILEAATLNLNNLPQQISVIKYIYNNTILPEKSPISKLVDYVSRMLLFKNVGNNMYIGFSNGSESLSSIIIRNNKVDDFKQFLTKQGIHYNLVSYTGVNGIQNLGVQFDNGKITSFDKIASSGTKTIWLFYCWMLQFSNLSLLVYDEFDTYLHYSTAQAVLSIINGFSNMQTVVTTHNLTLMNNLTTRPDCCFILDNNKIKSLCQLTKKEIREKNNLQKMYIDGEFSNYFVEK